MKLSYGVSSFEKLRSEGRYFADKTKDIETLENLPEICDVVFRPRRFGKTLFANMLGTYYDRAQLDSFDSLFQGTYIYAHPTPKRNAYMVLKFNFSAVYNSDMILYYATEYKPELRTGASASSGENYGSIL